jgi:hypothetical protein
MRLKFYIFCFLLIVVQATSADAQDKGDSELSREYQIKAAFIYNFMKFVDWPEGKTKDPNEPIIIGIIGKDPFGDLFDPITSKQIKGRKSLIRRFEGLEQLKKSRDADKLIESLRKCHLLFICSSEKENLTNIIHTVSKYSVLTIGEMPDVLESGGIINFLLKENKVHFEINLVAAKQANLTIRSQLLRLATRVINEEK